jgi:hypothetical protein
VQEKNRLSRTCQRTRTTSKHRYCYR